MYNKDIRGGIMADRRDLYYDIQFGGMDDYSDEMIEANQDLPTKLVIDDEVKLKQDDQLVPETDIEINGKDYHVTV